MKTPPAQMKSKKNLTRFDRDRAASFDGWRLCLCRTRTTFICYFSDKKFGGAQQSLAAAEKALAELKALLDRSKRVDGKVAESTVRRGEKLLAGAV